MINGFDLDNINLNEYEEAKKIMLDYADFLVYLQPLLATIFFSSIPLSFLPYDRETIQDALNYMGKYYNDIGDNKSSEACKNCFGTLIGYEEDEKILESMLNIYDKPKMRALATERIKNYKTDNLPGFLKALHTNKEKEDD